MPRANRHSLPGCVWHITHRCHEKKFLLRYSRDRNTWLQWLQEARERYGLCVLNYAVTCNHIHVLVQDRGENEIARSMQLVAGCTGQQYNARKSRRGAFWEDRYHATAVQADGHLARCMVYVDLNMVRAGVVRHPSEWPDCGYSEIQSRPEQRRVVNTDRLVSLLGLRSVSQLRQVHRRWVSNAIGKGSMAREPQWSDGVAIGNPDFLEAIRRELWPRLPGRKLRACTDGYQLREVALDYRN